MQNARQLQEGETITYEGPITEYTSRMKPKVGNGFVTNQRCYFKWADGEFEATKEEIVDLEIEPFLIAALTKLIIKRKDGTTMCLQIKRSLIPALQALASKEVDTSWTEKPKLEDVKNGYTWFAAVSPVPLIYLAGMIGGVGPVLASFSLSFALSFIGRLIWAGIVGALWLYMVRFILALDIAALQDQGYDTSELKLEKTEGFYAYLFKRAKVFGHTYLYAAVWCCSFLWGLTSLWFILFSSDMELVRAMRR